MTICIAAGCLDNYRHRIVLCADWRMTNAIGTLDVALKLRSLPKNFKCLTAGKDSEILSLVHLLRDDLQNVASIDETNIKTIVDGVLSRRKKQKAEEYIQSRLAITYSDFISFGKDKLPSDIFREMIFEITKITIGAELIIAGFAGNQTIIIETTDEGTAHLRDDFAAVGSGAYLAQASLLARGQNYGRPTDETIYCVYEAKKQSQNIKSVGESTYLLVLYDDGSAKEIKRSGQKILDDCVAKYGPQRVRELPSTSVLFAEEPSTVPASEESKP